MWSLWLSKSEPTEGMPRAGHLRPLYHPGQGLRLAWRTLGTPGSWRGRPEGQGGWTALDVAEVGGEQRDLPRGCVAGRGPADLMYTASPSLARGGVRDGNEGSCVLG